MEEKLEELKRQWCKFYCEYKNEGDIDGIYPCEFCQVENYIRFIKYDL